jgi:hypothetical protein
MNRPSAVGERIGATERVESMRREDAAEAAVLAASAATPAPATPERTAQETVAPEKTARRSLEDIRRDARENWAAQRAASLVAERAREATPGREAEPLKESSHELPERPVTRRPDDDLVL